MHYTKHPEITKAMKKLLNEYHNDLTESEVIRKKELVNCMEALCIAFPLACSKAYKELNIPSTNS